MHMDTPSYVKVDIASIHTSSQQHACNINAKVLQPKMHMHVKNSLTETNEKT